MLGSRSRDSGTPDQCVLLEEGTGPFLRKTDSDETLRPREFRCVSQERNP